MAQVLVPFQGQEEIFKRFLGINSPGNLKLRLYSDDRTPGQSDEVSIFTEISEGGYSAIDIEPSDWTVSTIDNITQAELALQTFTFTGPISRINGYYITDSTGAILIHAERFTEAPLENYNEGSLEISIKLTIG